MLCTPKLSFFSLSGGVQKMKPVEIFTGVNFPIFADSETRANLVIVFGLTNIDGSWWTNQKRKFTGS